MCSGSGKFKRSNAVYLITVRIENKLYLADKNNR